MDGGASTEDLNQKRAEAFKPKSVALAY